MRRLSIFRKIVRLIYGKIKYFGSIPKWAPVFLRFCLKSHRKYFDVFTHLTVKERLLLYKLALSLPERAICVEIGSYLGASALFLASGIKERLGHLYCVDTWKNDAMSEGPRDTFNEFLSNINEFLDNNIITPMRGYSTEVAKTFDKEIDLLFIDGDHSYKAVKANIESYLPKLRDKGIVIFHDYSWAEGVRQAVSEYIKPIAIEEHYLDNTYWARIKKYG
jgi:predicted O-methyltransferase YrrM